MLGRQRLADMLFQLRRPGDGREALHAPLRRRDQELGEIPADRAAQEARSRLFEGDEQRMGAFAVDVDAWPLPESCVKRVRQKVWISALLPGSWPPNWLQGKTITRSPWAR